MYGAAGLETGRKRSAVYARRMPHRRRRSRPRPSRRLRRKTPFWLLVAGVALLAFLVTLNWPLTERLGPPAARVLETIRPRLDPPAPDAPRFACAVARITDGDTLRCADGTRIRLHAVAARETDETCSPGHPCPAASAAAATRELARLAGGQTLSCQSTGRSYDRVTAICWTPRGEEINCAMIRSGTTVVWERFNRETPLCRP